MFSIVVCMKISDSYERLKALSKKENIEWEEYISEFEELQERLGYKGYDLAIVDTKLWWADEAIDLLRIKNIDVIEFSGDFFETLKEIEKKVPEPVTETEEDEVLNVKKQSQPKVIIQEKVVVKEKIIYKSKNIKQRIFSFVTTDDPTMRDFTVCNVAAVLAENEKTIVIDLTNMTNLQYYLKIVKPHKSINPFKSELNGNNIKDFIDQNRFFDLLILDNEITKENIKTLLHALRDYENIIFVIENDMNNVLTKFVLNFSHRIFLITEPLVLSAKNNMKFVSDIIDSGQIEENVSIIFTDDIFDDETINCLYKGLDYYVFKRKEFLDNINNQELVEKEDEILFYEMLGIKRKKTFLQKIFDLRKGKNKDV